MVNFGIFVINLDLRKGNVIICTWKIFRDWDNYASFPETGAGSIGKTQFFPMKNKLLLAFLPDFPFAEIGVSSNKK